MANSVNNDTAMQAQSHWSTRMAKRFQGPHKWEAFLYVLVGVLAVSSAGSFVAKKALFQDDAGSRPILGVLADEATPEGKSLALGARLLADELNAGAGYRGRKLEARVFKPGAAGAKEAIAIGKLAAAVGGLDAEAAQAFAAAKLPFEQVASGLGGTGTTGTAGYRLDAASEARFVANYERNIAQNRIAYVVREDSAAWEQAAKPFSELYAKFDTPVQKEFVVVPGKVDETVAELKKLDFGLVYLAASPELSAKVLSAMRKAGVVLEVAGPSTLSSGAFQSALDKEAGKDAELSVQGTMALAPVLFDTAAAGAQRFKQAWSAKAKSVFCPDAAESCAAQVAANPDWVGVLARDASIAALEKAGGFGAGKPEQISDAGLGSPAFQMGIYSGSQIVSAPVQLFPMPKGAGYDYMEALKSGKVLYVNDRFMFKSNVVYAGVTLNSISDVDTYGESATIDFTIWFRFKGAFEPKDLVFDNALEDVKFAAPEESGQSGDVKYRKYRTKAKFKLNFNGEARAYGQHFAGIQFRHKSLNRSNMIFVSDVQGMPSGVDLGADMAERRVANPSSGWVVDGGSISQSLQMKHPEGAPQYIGNTGEKPQFSTVTMGARLKQDGFSVIGGIQREWLVYLTITGLVGWLAAKALDARSLGRLMSLQSWILRVVFMPMFVAGLGGIAIDKAYASGSIEAIKAALIVSGSLWWILGAYLGSMALKRFVWEPLEERATRKIPNVMKGLGGFLMYAIGFAGIVGVVLDKSMTSILAASGVLAMVVGLAVKSNIANVFSGIVLNIERPFRVGDYVKVGSVTGQVMDITWRTIRLETSDGTMMMMANSKVSEASVENLSSAPSGLAADTTFNLPPRIDPKTAIAAITTAAMECTSIVNKEDPGAAPKTRFKGLMRVDGDMVAQFVVGYRVKTGSKKSAAREEMWLLLRDKFIAMGILDPLDAKA